MAITKSQTTRWAAKVKVEAMENSIAATVADLSYQTEAVGADTIKIVGVADPTINVYVPGAGLTYEKLTDNETDLSLNQMHDFAFEVNEVEVAQSTPDFVPAAVEKAGKLLALKADTYIFGSNTYGNASIPAGNKFGSIGSSIALTTDNIEEYLDKMATALSENNVGGAYCILPPKAMSLIRRAGFASVTDNAAMWAGRTVSSYAGLTLIQSNQVAKAGTGSDEYQILAFSPRAIPMAATTQKVESLKNPDDFGDLVRGLYVFGSVVLFPSEVSVLSGTIS
jgi:hypothetical protein